MRAEKRATISILLITPTHSSLSLYIAHLLKATPAAALAAAPAAVAPGLGPLNGSLAAPAATLAAAPAAVALAL